MVSKTGSNDWHGGAKIFYEDVQRETTPQLVTDLKPGRYPLLVEKPGYLNTRVI